MAHPYPRGSLEVLYITRWARPGVLAWGVVNPSSHSRPTSQEGCILLTAQAEGRCGVCVCALFSSACGGQPSSGGAQRSLGSGGGAGVYTAHGRRTAEQESAARTNQARLVGSSNSLSKQQDAATPALVRGRQFSKRSVNTPRKRANTEQREGVGPDCGPQQTRH